MNEGLGRLIGVQAAKLETHVRDLSWVVELVDASTPPPKRPKRYRKQVRVN